MKKVLEIKNVYKNFGKHKILKDISFDVHEREIVGFIGPNGAGKSTLMKCISGLIFPTSGTIKVCGYDMDKDRTAALHNQASLIEQPGLYTTMSGRDNLKLMAKLRGVDEARLNEVYEFTRLGKHLDKSIARYSLGMKQRLALGIVVLSKPRFVILDEPTNGLDPKGIMELRHMLKRLVDKEGISILLSSHSLSEIDKIADRIVCINQGALIDLPDGLFQSASYVIETKTPEQVLARLNEFSGFKRLELNEAGVLFELQTKKDFSSVVSLLNGLDFTSLYKQEMNMEQIYVTLYGNVG